MLPSGRLQNTRILTILVQVKEDIMVICFFINLRCPEKGRVAKLFIGSTLLSRDSHEQYGGQHHGEILIRTGSSTLSTGLIKLNKKGVKVRFFGQRYGLYNQRKRKESWNH